MKITVTQVNDGTKEFTKIFLCKIKQEKSDLVVLNEMPLGSWISKDSEYSHSLVSKSIMCHRLGVEQLKSIGSSVLFSIPDYEDSVDTANKKAINTAVFINEKGETHTPHTKQFFPEEAGFWETQWFQKGKVKFNPFEVITQEGVVVKVGVLLCSDAMFLEYARYYSNQGVSIIAIPRATTGECDNLWIQVLKTMALLSGCYVISSNRFSQNMNEVEQVDQKFNGKGWIFDPNGVLIAETSKEKPFVTCKIDLSKVKNAQNNYPCYIKE